MAVLKLSRPYEDVYFDDPEENPGTPRFRVYFDDRSIERLLGKVASAIDRAQEIDRKIEGARSDEERAEATEAMVHLEKRVIVAFIGPDGYDALLEWMGDGSPIDPDENINMLGEVMAQLLMLLGEKATNEQLRRCGAYFKDSARTASALGAPRPGKRGGKKRRK